MHPSRQVLPEIGLPPAAANPLVARSFAAHLQACERNSLLQVPHFGRVAWSIGNPVP